MGTGGEIIFFKLLFSNKYSKTSQKNLKEKFNPPVYNYVKD
jgi:hypothetical protein